MLTEIEADSLIQMHKIFLSPPTILLLPGTDESHDLVGDYGRERFLLDLWRGTLRLSKIKLQTRGRKTVVLVRLDVASAPHTNPDGSRLGGTHLHVYRQGYEDKWAYPLNPEEFRDPSNILETFRDFCQ